MIPSAGREAATLAICCLVIIAMLVRPSRIPEAVWACTGAAALVLLGLISSDQAWHAVLRGSDVYLFLTGMMLIAELARREGLFNWLAAHAVGWSRGSPVRLFTLVYLIGVGVTAFLSNDAAAVVMTPAVYAAARRAEADPLPALFACAFVANAASFVLPVSNPANLVLFGGAMPPLGAWLAAFALPSALAIVATYVALRFAERDRLRGKCRTDAAIVRLSPGGLIVLLGICATSGLLLAVSALNRPLGFPTFVAAAAIAVVLLARRPSDVRGTLSGVMWGVLPLVSGLFILVASLENAGLITHVSSMLGAAMHDPPKAAAGAGVVVALTSNVTNNLPAGLVVGTVISHAHPPRMVADAMLIGIDLGPNLSITGSLATILWLATIRREGEDVTFLRFLRAGLLVMPPALISALAARLAIG
jgi:arsenical pump membrane protein